jgi:long-chain acyl-CoA synthetase
VRRPANCHGLLARRRYNRPDAAQAHQDGGLAFLHSERFVHISRRSKDLIIRGGQNIAPLEIDGVLLRHSGMLDAAAVGVPDKIHGEEVVCYVVPKESAFPKPACPSTL